MLVLKRNDIAALAERLDLAEREGRELEPLTAEHPGLPVDQAYEIQAELVRLKELRGERVVGYKMGLTSKAKMEQMGVHSPIFGVLTDRMRTEQDAPYPLSGSIHPRIEPEIAFEIGVEPPARPTAEQALAACARACAAMEIIDSRYRAFKFTLADVIADDCSCRGFVLGAWRPVPSMERLGELSMRLSVDGRNVRNGSSSHILGHPAASLQTLCGMLAERGLSLQRGDIVLAGAATEAVPLEAGSRFEAEVEELGKVRVSAR